MAMTGSDSTDQDFKLVADQVKGVIDNDFRVPEFLELFRPLQTPSSSVYEVIPDVATLSEAKPYPAKVMQAIEIAKHRVFFGSFPDIPKFYCTIDNSLYLWDPDVPENVKEYSDFGGLITCVASGGPEPTVYTKNVASIITVASSTRISIIPVGINTFYTHAIISSPLHFTITSLCVSQSGRIFAGSDRGDVVEFTYKLKKAASIKPRKLRIPIPGFSIPVKKVAFEEKTGLLAVLDIKSSITVYTVGEKVAKTSYLKSREGETIIQLVAIPPSDSSYTRFVGFTDKGDRLLYWLAPGLMDDEQEFVLKDVRPAPEQFTGHKLIDASFTLGYSTFVFDKFTAVSRPQISTNTILMDPAEVITIFESTTQNLSICQGTHLFHSATSPIFKHESLWQHITLFPPSHLFTTEGVRFMKPLLPVDRLSKLLSQHRGSFNSSIRDYFADGTEGAITSILLASLSPALRRYALHSLHHYSTLTKLEGRPTLAFQAFLGRTARLLSPLWNNPVITKSLRNPDKFTPTPFPSSLPSSLKLVSQLIDEYLTISSSAQQNMQSQQNLEKREFYRLKAFLSNMVEVSLFLNHLTTSSKTLTQSLNKLTIEDQNRLTIMPLSSPEPIIPSLRRLASTLAAHSETLSLNLANDCPSLYDQADLLLSDTLEALKSDAQNPSLRQTLPENARNIFVNHSTRPLALSEITSAFLALGCPKFAVDVCTARAEAVDPHRRALHWYLLDASGREHDEEGRECFDRRAECYAPIIEKCNLKSVLDEALKSQDELLHVVLYKSLGIVADTEFSPAYLESEMPDRLWELSKLKGNYPEALQQLAKSGKNFGPIGAALAKAAGGGEIAKSARISLASEYVQNELLKRGEHPLTSNTQDLFNQCSEYGHWDLCLCLLSATNQKEGVSQAWRNFIVEELWGESEAVATSRLIAAAEKLESGSYALRADVIASALEEWRLARGGAPLWGVKTARECGVSLEDLIQFYLRGAEEEGSEVRCDFVYAALWATTQIESGKVERERVLKVADWFVKEGRLSSYYEDALRMIANIRQM